MRLKSKKGGTLTGSYDLDTASGTVTAAGRTTDFTLPDTNGSATLLRSLDKVNNAQVKGGWVILPGGTQVGVLSIDDSPQPAPSLDIASNTVDLNGDPPRAHPDQH